MDSFIVSLFKCLGLKGSAILLEDGVLQRNVCVLNEHLGLDTGNTDYLYMINSYLNTSSHIGDLSVADILLELEKEAQSRCENLKLFTNILQASKTGKIQKWIPSHFTKIAACCPSPTRRPSPPAAV